MYERIPEIMTCKECQNILKIGRNTLYSLINSREIEAFRIGNRWKIPKESVVEYIKEKM